jgi:preprotein translocase subunit SecE
MELNTENTKTSPSKTNNTLFWILASVLLVLGIVLNLVFSNLAFAIRIAGWLVLSCIIVLLIFQTEQGQKVWDFAKSARIELRKVVWPTRQDATQITLLIAALVVVVALILWGVDSILMWALSLLNR